MGLRINTNVQSFVAQNRLGKTQRELGTSLDRLSTGFKINTGKDDPVGLLKAESLTKQLRGIGAASASLDTANSLLGVAEGFLSQLNDVAQNLREKVVQASDGTISTSDRSNLNTAVTDLLNEYSRLASAAKFDGVALLSGTFVNKRFQVGADATDGISFSINDARASAIGTISLFTSVTQYTQVTGSSNTLTNPASIVINGVTVTTSSFTSDGVSTAEASESAIAYVNAINRFSAESGVTATALANVMTFTYNGADALASTDQLVINGITVTAAAYTADDSGATSLTSAINAVSIQTGVTATLDSTNDTVTLTADDGRNINIRYYATSGSQTSTALFGMGLSTNSSSGSVGNTILKRGSFTLSSDASSFTVAGTGVAASSTTATSNTNFTLSTLNVNTAGNSQTGLFILDNVIRQIQTRRSDIGSKQIRFQIASEELKSRTENLSAARSAIRDTDIAAETARLTQLQILQQAGVSVLSRANSLPQAALSLLQG